MTTHIVFFDGHNDLLLRLLRTPAPREASWLGTGDNSHLDLPRMKKAGLAGGLFAIFVPPVSSGPPPDFNALMAHPPYALPMPPGMTHMQAQPDALVGLRRLRPARPYRRRNRRACTVRSDGLTRIRRPADHEARTRELARLPQSVSDLMRDQPTGAQTPLPVRG